jgi:hypothetical protein
VPKGSLAHGSIDPRTELNPASEPPSVLPGRKECSLENLLRHRLATNQVHGQAVGSVLTLVNHFFEDGDVLPIDVLVWRCRALRCPDCRLFGLSVCKFKRWCHRALPRRVPISHVPVRPFFASWGPRVRGVIGPSFCAKGLRALRNPDDGSQKVTKTQVFPRGGAARSPGGPHFSAVGASPALETASKSQDLASTETGALP